MFCIANFQWIAKYILLSLPCFEFVLSITTERAQKLDYENNGSYDLDKRILQYNIFRFPTTKRYAWDYTLPTRKPPNSRSPLPRRTFFSYIVWALLLMAVLIFFVRICMKHPPGKNCCSAESGSHLSPSSEGFNGVVRPPESTDFIEELQRQPTRNQLPDSRTELFASPRRTGLFNEVDNTSNQTDAVGMNSTFMVSTGASSSQERRQVDNTVERNPPDYTTVILSDLVNPREPVFPCVKKDYETPPPEYGKEKPFFK